MQLFYKILFCFGIAGIPSLFYRPGESRCILSNKDSLCRGCRAYINETRKCYNIDSKGPCGEMMVVMSNTLDAQIGKCVCRTFPCGGRPTVYWIPENRCYFIYDQGPCASGHWLVPNEDNPGTCEKIPCPEEYNLQRPPFAGKQFLFSHEGKCYTSGVPGAGPCPPSKVAYFFSTKYTCAKRFACGGHASVSSGSNECEDGSEPDTFGGCEPITTI